MALSETVQKYLLSKQAQQQAPEVQATPETAYARAQKTVQAKVLCPECGNDFLYEINLQQYMPGYSSAAGGDLIPMNQAPQTIRLCLCGAIIGPNIGGQRGGKTPNDLINGLRAAIQNASAKRAKLAEIIATVARDAVSQEEFIQLRDRITEMSTPLEGVAGELVEGAPLVHREDFAVLESKVDVLMEMIKDLKTRTDTIEAVVAK